MITIKNLTKNIVDKKFLERVAKIVLKGENISKGKDFSIVFVDSSKIKEINRKYRGKNKATDVLSFGELNEIIICPAEVKKNAKRFGLSFKKELSLILIHGILHLLGYEHEDKEVEARKMEKRQDYYLSKI
ncbi:rRNA maturation RNase YbeY [Patescibacteria group bacterium]|nr:rRNA maturation RNase YbeY [Patescibacteria group bacterium]